MFKKKKIPSFLSTYFSLYRTDSGPVSDRIGQYQPKLENKKKKMGQRHPIGAPVVYGNLATEISIDMAINVIFVWRAHDLHQISSETQAEKWRTKNGIVIEVRKKNVGYALRIG